MTGAETSDVRSAARKIIVVGANGALGKALLTAIGPRGAVAVTRGVQSPIANFAHVRLSPDGEIPPAILSNSLSIINAAGRVRGGDVDLISANVTLARRIAQQARAAGLAKFVQVGSFSVYGEANCINRDTPIAPVTAYGRSKAAADEALLDLTTNDFAVESIRLPFLFSKERPALLAPLIGLGRRLRILPDSHPPVQRSMITYDDAAAMLISAATAPGSGVRLAADPQIFDYDLLRRLVCEESGQRWRKVPVPAIVAAIANATVPALGRRLFRSSVLSDQDNALGSQPMGLEVTLREIVKDLVR